MLRSRVHPQRVGIVQLGPAMDARMAVVGYLMPASVIPAVASLLSLSYLAALELAFLYPPFLIETPAATDSL